MNADKKKYKKIVLIIVMILIYAAGLILGIGILSGASLVEQRAEFMQRAEEMQSYYEEHPKEPENLPGSSRLNTLAVFDEDDLVYMSSSQEGVQYDLTMFERRCRSYIPKVLQGHVIDNMFFNIGGKGNLLEVYFITGIPLYEGENVEQTAFLIRDQKFLPNTLIVFAGYFTAIYWIAAVSIAITLIKRRQLEETRRSYIANVTHALKTPVVSVKALAETLYDGVEPDQKQRKKYCKMIMDEADNQTAMIQNILAISKLQSGSVVYDKKPFPVDEILTPVLAKYETLCKSRDIKLEVTDSIRNLPLLYTDAASIRQILGILLDNSVKFVQPSGTIIIDAETGKKKATISVSDNGQGIDKDALPHVFERFYASGASQMAGGNGLGLAIAGELTRSLHEKIWIESEPGAGTRVFFTVHLYQHS